ncbi:hypothetical protein Slin14017_G109950 [Septoria linicola]|nr:hypothetical protein Slin14017_G109950 [Septoria linicola]
MEHHAKNGSSKVVKIDERKYGIKRKNYRAENVKTLERAYMLALLHALGLAYSAHTKTGNELAQLHEVKVIITASEVVRTVNVHIPDFPPTSQFVEEMNDKSMIKRVVDSVTRLSRRDVQVSIAAVDGQDKALARARTLAKQKGSKACRSRQMLRGRREEIETDNETRLEDEAS